MDTTTKNHYKDVGTNRWLPYIIGVLGICGSILGWYILRQQEATTSSLNLLTLLPSKITLVLGLLSSFLLAFLIRVILLSAEHKRLLQKVNEDFDQEVDDRIHAEETKQKLEKALLQGQKLQAIGTLAGGIAHDFNNILYAIIGYVDMACEDTPDDSIIYKNLKKVLEAAHRGQELISRILTFSRRHHHEFKVICLKETLEGVLDLLKPTIPASVIIQFINKLPYECNILGNQTQLHQVIVNIINNSVDAMDGEGVVTIKLSHVFAKDELLTQLPKVTSNTNYCKIEITDTGHGMDQATMERMFEPFFTTKEVGKGTGLGMATVHAIIEEHQGEIIVNSQLGHGTTISILLPEHINKEIGNGKNSTR